VKETISTLDRPNSFSEDKSRGELVASVVHAQLPDRFHQRKAAEKSYNGGVEHVDQAPHVAWLREVYYQLAI
jgi:hypothetical protein